MSGDTGESTPERRRRTRPPPVILLALILVGVALFVALALGLNWNLQSNAIMDLQYGVLATFLAAGCVAAVGVVIGRTLAKFEEGNTIESREHFLWLSFWIGLFSSIAGLEIVLTSLVFGTRELVPSGQYSLLALSVAAVILTAIYLERSFRIHLEKLVRETRQLSHDLSGAYLTGARELREAFSTNTDFLLKEVTRLISEDKEARIRVERLRAESAQRTEVAERLRMMPQIRIALRVSGTFFHHVWVDVRNDGMIGHAVTVYVQESGGTKWKQIGGDISPQETKSLDFGDVKDFSSGVPTQIRVESTVTDAVGRQYSGARDFNYHVIRGFLGGTKDWDISPRGWVLLDLHQ